MNTLRHALSLQRSSEPEERYLCFSKKERANSLTVETQGRERWVLPWMQFMAGVHRILEKEESLTLTFVNHEVMIRGQNLRGLAENAASFQLEKVNELAPDFLTSDSQEVFVLKIQVRERRSSPLEQ